MHDVTTATTHGPLQPAFDCETEGASLDWNPRAAEAGSSRSTPMEDIWISPTWWP